MKLRLSVTNGQHVFSDHSDSFDFSEAGGTIGRSTRNDWVLPDPTRVVSGTHAEIGFKDGRFVIIDRSTNGVFLNGAETSLGAGGSAPLQDGDRFLIGDFEIAVEVLAEPDAEQSLPPWPVHDQGDLPPPVLPDDFNPDIAGWGQTAPDQVPDLFGSIDDLGAIRPDRPDADDSPDAGTQQPADTLPWDLSGIGEQWGAPQAAPPKPTGPTAPDADAGPPASPLDAGKPTPPPEVPEPPLPPNMVYEPAPEPAPRPRPKPPGPAPRSAATPPEPMPRGPAEGAGHGSEPMPDRGVHPGTEPDLGPLVHDHVPPPRQPAPSASPGPGAADLTPALEALLAGAGLSGQRIPAGATPELFHAVGELLALYASGTTELLRTISEIKNTFRISQTQIQQAENNPLRWAVSPREAVRRLLAPEDDAYLSPREAVIDAISSIKAHQIGSIRGMEASFKQFLSEQDPAELERGFERQGRPGPLTNKGAWCWQQYAAYHRRLTESAQDNVLELLGSAFSIAYEQQVRRIRGQQR
jgi:type VI secretion system FHA domain protein